MTEAALPRPATPRLAVLKALGDNTRYAIYLELARSPRPLATAEIAETLDLHPNTVRPHLERMRDVGLLTIETDARGTVGRPQHRYALAADAPSLGLEPATFPVLARMLLRVAAAGGVGRDEVVDAAREQGEADAIASVTAAAGTAGSEPTGTEPTDTEPTGAQPTGEPVSPGASVAPDALDASEPSDAQVCLELLVARLDAMGFDPAVALDGAGATVAFAHCPFRELAESNPEIVCSLHQGLVEGFVDTLGGATVDAFRPLTDRAPCQVDLVMAPADSP